MVVRLRRAPVVGGDGRRQGLAGLVLLALLVLRHGQDEARARPHDGGGFAVHQLDGIVKPALAIPRQALGEQAIRVGKLVSRAPGGHGALGERDGLP